MVERETLTVLFSINPDTKIAIIDISCPTPKIPVSKEKIRIGLPRNNVDNNRVIIMKIIARIVYSFLIFYYNF